MTLIPRQEEKNCFIACSEDKVKQGHCDCVNRMQSQALNIPNVVVPKGTYCDFYKKECIKDFCSVTPNWQKCKHLK